MLLSRASGCWRKARKQSIKNEKGSQAHQGQRNLKGRKAEPFLPALFVHLLNNVYNTVRCTKINQSQYKIYTHKKIAKFVYSQQ
jgi:hypothetical protein